MAVMIHELNLIFFVILMIMNTRDYNLAYRQSKAGSTGKHMLLQARNIIVEWC
jgi:hypothetical protein